MISSTLVKPVDSRLQMYVLLWRFVENCLNSHLYFQIMFNTSKIYWEKIFLLRSFDFVFLSINGNCTLENVFFFNSFPLKKISRHAPA